MNKEDKKEIIRLGGWALMFGAIAVFMLFLGLYLENNINDSTWTVKSVYRSLLYDILRTNSNPVNGWDAGSANPLR